MDRELLLELGTEELPASWLPGLTRQIRDGIDGALRAHRLNPDAPIESYSTPRRLTARIAKIAERQNDIDEVLTGPPVGAAFDAAGQPTPAAVGFARKNNVDVNLLERVETPKGTYLGYRRHQRGKAAVDVLPDVLATTLRSFSFPKAMHWDAYLEDGKGELLFGRPIRWILYLYGGRVVPFTIRRTELSESAAVQEVVSAAVTYGHRFLTTSGRAGRAVKVRTFDDYQARLAEHFVILDRQERQDRIGRTLEAKARGLGGRVGGAAMLHSTLLDEVPDLIEYPTVMAGTFAREFLIAARRSADDHHDSPSAQLPGRRRCRSPETGVSRRHQHRCRRTRRTWLAITSGCWEPVCGTRASSGTPIASTGSTIVSSG